MDKIKSLKTIFQIFNVAILAVFIGAIFFAAYQFYNNIVSPIQNRQNRLEQKDQIIPSEFIDQAEKTEKTSFDSYSTETVSQTARDYLLNVRNRDYIEAYKSISPNLKKTYSIKSFEDQISSKHSGKIVRYRLDSMQIMNNNIRKLQITAFTLDQNNQSDNYTFELTFIKANTPKSPWLLDASVGALG